MRIVWRHKNTSIIYLFFKGFLSHFSSHHSLLDVFLWRHAWYFPLSLVRVEQFFIAKRICSISEKRVISYTININIFDLSFCFQFFLYTFSIKIDKINVSRVQITKVVCSCFPPWYCYLQMLRYYWIIMSKFLNKIWAEVCSKNNLGEWFW